MKYLETSYTGGQPVFLDDIEWQLSGITQALSGLVSAVVPSGMVAILSGCSRSVTASTVTIGQGYVLFNGEVCRVPAHSFPDGSAVEYWTETIVFDPSGTSNYNTPGLTHDVYAERIVKVKGAAVLPAGAIPYAGTKALSQYIHEALPLDDWHLFKNLVVGASGVIPGTYQLFAKKDLSGFVHLRGTMYFEDIGTGAVNHTVATLPVGYRPPVSQTFAVSAIKTPATAEVDTSIITIQPTGEIILKATSMGGAFVLDFGQITPFSIS